MLQDEHPTRAIRFLNEHLFVLPGEQAVKVSVLKPNNLFLLILPQIHYSLKTGVVCL